MVLVNDVNSIYVHPLPKMYMLQFVSISWPQV